MAEAEDPEAQLIKDILAQKASGAEWSPNMVAGMEAELSRLYSEAPASEVTEPPPPAVLPCQGSAAWGTWEQSSDAITFEISVDAATRSADVRCECLVGFLDVRCNDEPLLSGRLALEVMATELTWALEDIDDSRVLIVELPRRKRGNIAGGFTDEPIFESVRIGGEECAMPGAVPGLTRVPV